MKKIATVILLSWLVCSCATKEKTLTEQNPPCEGFDLDNSDPAAIELADSIMHAMGGRESWDKTRFISWNFFGNRKLVWDKFDGRVRIENPRDSIIYLTNINTDEGRVQVKGIELTEPDSLKKMLKRAKSIWINDSYWLVMPFKLKDSGVTLKYLGEDTLQGPQLYNVLQLTFKQVGDTPDNKYEVYVDLHDKLIKHWSYFSASSKDSANWTRPWDNYQRYGSILLSADRSDNRGPGNVKVDETLDDKIFTEF
ncbi:MAG: hypothetical protein JJE09_00140 [Bacteroidia bacterium]|nr:hypothetical protein [Bacteroidia bacterium]